MPQPSNSFKQFNYGLRPSKQVERKLMIEILLRLSKAGYDISSYTYVGFGSVYYIDFVMFHKFLFMESMICVEWGDIHKRMKFNKPFKFIKLKMGALLNHIPDLQRNKKYLIWLDYDRPLDPDMLQDIDGCLGRLAKGSIFIITIDARARLPKEDYDLENMTAKQREKLTVRVYREWFGAYLEDRITLDSIAPADVPGLFYNVVLERMRQSLSIREDVQFLQVFNFLYADGAPMLTIGGVIGGEEDAERLQDSGIMQHRCVREGQVPLEISVPPLTIREKQWLDSKMDRNLQADGLQFELDEDLLDTYRLFYKEYPTFTEAML